MGTTKKAAAPAAATGEKQERKPRTVLTPAQKIQRAEEELAELRRKAAEKASEKVRKLRERRDKMVAGRDALNQKIADLEAEIRTEAQLAGESDEDEPLPGTEATPDEG